MESVIDKEFAKYFSQLEEREKKSIVLLIKTFLAGKQQSSERISLERYNKEIDEALAEVAAGNYVSQEEMEKMAAKW